MPLSVISTPVKGCMVIARSCTVCPIGTDSAPGTSRISSIPKSHLQEA